MMETQIGWMYKAVIVVAIILLIGFFVPVKVSEEVSLSYEVTFDTVTETFVLSNTDEVPGTFEVVFNFWPHSRDIREGYSMKEVLYLEPGQAEVIQVTTDKLDSYPAVMTLDGRLSHYWTDYQVTPDTKMSTKRVSLFKYLFSRF